MVPLCYHTSMLYKLQPPKDIHQSRDFDGAVSVSTACCERGFSCMTRVKNDWRSSLITPSLTRLMYLKLEGPHLDAFDATHRWWGSGHHMRRPGFSTWEASNQEESVADFTAKLQEIEEKVVPLLGPGVLEQSVSINADTPCCSHT